jgi:hypothetical protein
MNDFTQTPSDTLLDMRNSAARTYARSALQGLPDASLLAWFDGIDREIVARTNAGRL